MQGVRWLLGVTAAVALLLVAAATGTAAAVKRYDRHGVSFTYPAAWVVTTRPLSNVTNPRYRVTVSTAPVERTSRDDGPCLSGIAGQLPKDAVLMYVMEALGTDRTVSLPRMQPRPRSFRLPARSDNALCGFNGGGLWVPFKSGGRVFYLGVYVGPAASAAARAALRRLVDGMRIEPR